MSRDALVVGISAYQNLPGLQAPAQDAEAIAQRLQNQGDFRVTRLPEVIHKGHPKVGTKTHVSLRELEAALVRLFKPKGSNIPQTALFYFSGHGLQKDTGIQEGFLAVSDSHPDVGFYGLSLFWLRRLLQESPVRQRIVLLDCCHSGELLNFLEADPGAYSGTDRLFMAASREYESAYESIDSSYSVFTQALLTGLDPARLESGIVTNYSLTDWVSSSLKGEIQQPLFENSGSEIVLTRCVSQRQVIKVEPSSAICPYRGLEFFDEAHAEYFFGREDLTDQLIEKLRSDKFVAVVGASGSGKSSLVRAGLIRELRKGQKFSGSDRWRIKLITPTEHPLKSLAAAFIDSEASDLERAEQLRRAETFLQNGGEGLAQLAQATTKRDIGGESTLIQLPGVEPRSPARLLLVIDQFEEVFTLCRGPQSEQARRRFFNCLIGALQEAGDCLSIVIVLRADFFSKCSLYSDLAQQIEQHLVITTPLTYEQIKATIVRPAQKVGLVCNPNLVYTMLLDVVGAPGELPLLQYTLRELWERREENPDDGTSCLTLDAYTELGGVRGTLQKRATEIFYSLTCEEQRVAKRVFLALTQLGEGTEDTRRRIFKSELVSPSFPMELIEETLEKLVAAKLLVTNQVKEGNKLAEKKEDILHQQSVSREQSTCFSQETIDVAHEALIRNWSLLRNWLDENRDMLQRQRRIEQAAQEWDSAGQLMGGGYLLRGTRLSDAEDFLSHYPDELSALAYRYVAVSQEESYRSQKESRVLQVSVPCALLVALAVTFNQYRAATQTQAEKDYQLHIAMSRQQAAIAQTILQESDGDPTTALLISRLAAEGGQTYEAQASLRAALQNLRLQAELKGHEEAVNQVVFSPDQRHVATASADGTVRLWSSDPQVNRSSNLPLQVLRWSTANPNAQAEGLKADITFLAFSPDGKWLAAAAKGFQNVQVWSVETGALVHQLTGFEQEVKQVIFSPDSSWIVASTDKAIRVWKTETGQLQATLPQKGPIRSTQFSPNGQMLLTSSADGTAQVWQLTKQEPHLQVQLIKSFRHPGAVNNASFSSDGQLVATACDDGNARLWNVATGQLRQIFSQKPSVLPTSGVEGDRFSPQPESSNFQPVLQVVFSPDQQLLASVGLNGEIWLWNIHSGQLQIQLGGGGDPSQLSHFAGPEPIAFSPDGRTVATTSREQLNLNTDQNSYRVQLWNIPTGQRMGVLDGHAGSVTAIQFNHDGTHLATASTDGVARLWVAEPGGELPTLIMPHAPAQWATFLTSNTSWNHIRPAMPRVRDAYQASLRQPRVPQANDLVTLEVSETGISRFQRNKTTTSNSLPSLETVTSGVTTNIVTVAADGTLKRWNVLTGQPADKAIDVTTELLSSANTDAVEIKAWNFFGYLKTFLRRSKESGVGAIASPYSSSAGATLVASHPASATQTATEGTTASSVRTEISHLLPEQSGKSANTTLSGVAFSSDGQLIATATSEGFIKIWRSQSGQAARLIHQIRNERVATGETANQPTSSSVTMIRQLAFSPDGRQLLGVSDDLTARLWNVQTGQQVQVLAGHQAAIQQAQFSFDGQRVVTASWDHTARIWEAASGRVLQVLQHQDVVSSAYFSPNNQQVVTASWDGTARVNDVATGSPRVILTGHRGPLLDAEFSPDGRALVTASADGTARIWDAQTGMEQAQLRPGKLNETTQIQRAFFSPDGQYVATLMSNGRVHLWAATWEVLLNLARDRSPRQLSPQECVRYLRLSPDNCPSLELGSVMATSRE